MTLRQRILHQMMIATTVITVVSISAQAEAADASTNGELIGDPFLNYFALGLLFFVVAVLFYGIIAIHDIPAQIAHSRNHPHEDAIHAAGWVSLFTLHALWPFLWIWAMAYRPERGWGMSPKASDSADTVHDLDRVTVEDLQARLAALEARLTSHSAPATDTPPTAPALEREVIR